MCEHLGVSRNACYKWKHKQAVAASFTSNPNRLKALIHKIWEDGRRLYGSPKIAEMLKRHGEFYSTAYVARLMKEMGIRSMVKQKFVATTDSGHAYPVCENLLDREFEVTELGKVWVSDLTATPGLI